MSGLTLIIAPNADGTKNFYVMLPRDDEGKVSVDTLLVLGETPEEAGAGVTAYLTEQEADA